MSSGTCVVGLILRAQVLEKQVGYTVASVLLNETQCFAIGDQPVREDIISRSEIFQCLGLNFVANVGGREFADARGGRAARAPQRRRAAIVRKKAALAFSAYSAATRRSSSPRRFRASSRICWTKETSEFCLGCCLC